MWVGFFLVCVGILILLNNMGLLRGDVWGYVWPVFFIMLGFSMIIKRLKNREREIYSSSDYKIEQPPKESGPQ